MARDLSPRIHEQIRCIIPTRRQLGASTDDPVVRAHLHEWDR